MLKIIGLLVIAPLFLGATCADQRYPIATWEAVQANRTANGLEPLEWDSLLFWGADKEGQALADSMVGEYFKYVPPYVSIVPIGTEGGHLCEIAGVIGIALDQRDLGRYWVSDLAARKCLSGPQYRHAAIAAYVDPNGVIYEVMLLTD
jgi:hypothetical protein